MPCPIALPSTLMGLTINSTDKPSRKDSSTSKNDDDDTSDDENCDIEAWNMFRTSFQQVQSVLDQNRALIDEVNDNHQSKVHDNLTNNVGLIRQIHGNITKVLSMYSDLSVNLSKVVRQRRRVITSKEEDKNETSSEEGQTRNFKDES